MFANNSRMFRSILAGFLLSVVTGNVSFSEPLSALEGEPLLTVSGLLTNTNVDNTAVFSLDMLKSLNQVEIETSTIWTEGVHTYTGVSLLELVEIVEANGETLNATAINDYAVEIPTTDAVEDGPIIAYLIDGEEISIRDKGPLWIIYPFDSNEDYRSEVIYARSIWQLDRIVITE